VRRTVVALALATLAVAGCTSESSDNGQSSGPDSDLATFELGHRPSEGDATLERISEMLTTLEGVCTDNTRLQLADATAGVISLLDEKGIEVTPTQVLEDAVTASDAYAIGPPGRTVDCLNLFALLGLSYESGQR
jgi:ABC-type phosphate/phosphonate transport system substrate-binding protein